MTTGEYLVANSTLPSGTALQHLLALQIGGGGPATTVFAYGLAVRQEVPHTVTSSVARGEINAFSQETRVFVSTAKKDAEHVTVRHSTNTLHALTGAPEKLYIGRKTAVHYTKKG